MIWVQLSKAEGLLKNGTYTNKFILSYVLFISIFQSFAINLGTKTVDESKWLAVLFIFSEILINILGIYHLLKINQEGDKKDFLNRYVVLVFVVVLMLFLISIPLILLSLLLLHSITKIDFDTDNFWFLYCLMTTLLIIYYAFLGKSFKRVTL